MIPSRGKRMTTCNHTRKKRELPHLVGRQIVSAAGAAAAGRSSAETETVRFYVPSGNGELYCKVCCGLTAAVLIFLQSR